MLLCVTACCCASRSQLSLGRERRETYSSQCCTECSLQFLYELSCVSLYPVGDRPHEQDSTGETAHFIFTHALAAASVVGKPDQISQKRRASPSSAFPDLAKHPSSQDGNPPGGVGFFRLKCNFNLKVSPRQRTLFCFCFDSDWNGS